MDVFSYAYPISSPTFKGDPLPYIRDLLDQGYELIGAFFVIALHPPTFDV